MLQFFVGIRLMKKVLKFFVFVVLVPVAVSLPVFLTQTINEDAKVYAQADSLQERINTYKATLKDTPSRSQLDRLKLRCNVSQTALKNLQTRVGATQEKRVGAYGTIQTKLDELITVLEQKDIELTDLKAQTAEFEKKVASFTEDLEAYKQAVDDAAALDCTEDPLALRAAIQEGRNRLTKLVSSVGEIRSHVNNLLKPSLLKVKEDLVTQANTAESSPAPSEPEGVNTDGTE